MNRRKQPTALAAGLLAVSLLVTPTCAAGQTELEAAAAYVREQGIMVGDANGNMNLGAGLSRAELAVLLVRLCGGEEELLANANYCAADCRFTDVPQWARPFVGYCVRNGLVAGYDTLHYGAADPVTPAAACTVILRARGISDGGGSVWSYHTAAAYAAGLGWIDQSAVNTSAMTRGDMAVLICRAMSSTQNKGTGYLTNGKPITEENVLELLHEIETDWPAGTVWGTRNTPGTHKNEVPSTAANRVTDHYWVSGTYACGGYASMVSSLVFGDAANPARQVTDLAQIRPGDIIFRIRNDTGKVWHVTVALESPNDMNSFHYTDGNSGGQVRWPEPESPYSRENLVCFSSEGKTYRIEAWTRYPESTRYTGQSVNAWGIPAP